MKPVRIALVVLAVVLAVACKRSPEGERSRYLQAKDRLEALATKNPSIKPDILAKVGEFDKAFAAAQKQDGEAAVKALTELNDRVTAYEKVVAPQPQPAKAAAPDAGVKKLGDKLGGVPDAGPAPGSKLGGLDTGAAGKLGTPAPAPKLGVPTPAGAPAAAPAAPSPPPAVLPVKPAGSGFGGPDAGTKSGFGGK